MHDPSTGNNKHMRPRKAHFVAKGHVASLRSPCVHELGRASASPPPLPVRQLPWREPSAPQLLRLSLRRGRWATSVAGTVPGAYAGTVTGAQGGIAPGVVCVHLRFGRRSPLPAKSNRRAQCGKSCGKLTHAPQSWSRLPRTWSTFCPALVESVASATTRPVVSNRNITMLSHSSC